MIVTLGFHEHIVYSRLFRESVYQSYGVQVLGCWNFRHTPDCPICLQQDRFVELPEEFYDGCIKLSFAITDSRNSDGSTFQLSNFGFGHDRSLLGGFRLSWARLDSVLGPVMGLC